MHGVALDLQQQQRTAQHSGQSVSHLQQWSLSCLATNNWHFLKWSSTSVSHLPILLVATLNPPEALSAAHIPLHTKSYWYASLGWWSCSVREGRSQRTHQQQRIEK
jgi:hypothetical protein